jgi:branched-chain amino acid aminotransferase
VIVIVDKIAIWPAERISRVSRSSPRGTPIPHRESLSPRIKSLNYLCHAMAKMEANVAGADEALMLDTTGHVAEGNRSERLRGEGPGAAHAAPPRRILAGVTRGVVMQLAREAGCEVKEDMLNRFDIYTAHEAFLTGSASEIAPIRSYDGRTVGSGAAGPVTRDLMARFQAVVRAG